MVGRLPFFWFVLNLFSVHRHVHAFLRGRPPASVHVHLSPQALRLLYEAVEEADGKGRILYPVHQIRGLLRENASGQKVVTKGLLSVDETRPTKQKIRCHRAWSPITRLQRVFLVCFIECIYSIILFEIKHVYSCHVLFFVVLQYRMYRPILLLHIVIESRGLCVSQPIFLFLLSFPRFMSSRRCLEFYMQDPEHDWDLQIRLGLDIVQARWFHIVGVSFFWTIDLYIENLNEWTKINICIQTPDLLTNQSDIPSMEPHLPYTTIYQ